jgi:hypothetical protein
VSRAGEPRSRVEAAAYESGAAAAAVAGSGAEHLPGGSHHASATEQQEALPAFSGDVKPLLTPGETRALYRPLNNRHSWLTASQAGTTGEHRGFPWQSCVLSRHGESLCKIGLLCRGMPFCQEWRGGSPERFTAGYVSWGTHTFRRRPC